MKGLSVKSSYAPEVFKLNGHARSGELTPEWAAYDQLREVKDDANGVVSFRDIQTQVDITASGGRVPSATAQEISAQQPWRLKGAWVRDGEFNALLTLGSANKSKTYVLSGERGGLSVEERLR